LPVRVPGRIRCEFVIAGNIETRDDERVIEAVQQERSSSRRSPIAAPAVGRPPLGTLAWSRATGGITNRYERLQMIAGGIGLLLGSLPARVRQRLGLRNPKAIVYDLERLPVPDSPEARRAEQLCEDVDSPMILSHSHRTYVWGILLGILGDHRPDHELLYVAALLHDLTLTDKYRDITPEISCFAAKGAGAAATWAREWGWSAERGEALGDAICLHLNTSVPPERGVEAHLLHAAAALDVIGHGHWKIAPATVSAVLERYPRLGMKQNGLQLFSAVSHPGTRTHVLNHRLMFPALVRHSQFDE
jgi:hypothetical protein